MAKVTTQNQRASQYSSEKTYKWEPADVFEITGQQFAALYHAVSQEVTDKGGAPVRLKYEAYEVIMDILKRGIEQGVIKETTDLPRMKAAETATGIDNSMKALFPEG